MKQNKERYNFTLSPSIKALLGRLAEDMNRSESSTLEELIREEAKKRNLKKK